MIQKEKKWERLNPVIYTLYIFKECKQDEWWREVDRSKHSQPSIPMLSRALMWDNSSCVDTF